MEVEFVYQVMGTTGWTELEESAERATRLNKNFSGYAIEPPAADETAGIVRLRSSGHDRTAIARRILAPIRSVFHRAGIAPDRIMLLQQTVLPTGRNLTMAEGRTPKGTFSTSELHQMLADGASIERRVGSAEPSA